MLLRVTKKNKVTITFFSLLIVSILLMSFDVKKRGRLNILEEFLIESALAVQKAALYSMESLRDVWFGYIYLVGVKEENLSLKNEVSELRGKLNSAREAVQENMRLKDLLAFKNSSTYHTVSARLIGVDSTNLFKTVTIGKGSVDGLTRGLPVVTKDGVVGRVLSTTYYSSKVLLITDRNSDVDAIVQRNREKGIAEGGDSDLMQLKYLSRSADAQVGDIIITSGVGGVFPKGLILGYISRLDKSAGGLFLTAEMKPAVDFSRLEEVLVITDSQEGGGL